MFITKVYVLIDTERPENGYTWLSLCSLNMTLYSWLDRRLPFPDDCLLNILLLSREAIHTEIPSFLHVEPSVIGADFNSHSTYKSLISTPKFLFYIINNLRMYCFKDKINLYSNNSLYFYQLQFIFAILCFANQIASPQ